MKPTPISVKPNTLSAGVAMSAVGVGLAILFCTGLSFGESGKKSTKANLKASLCGDPDGRPNRQQFVSKLSTLRNDQVNSGPRVVESSAVQNLSVGCESPVNERDATETCVPSIVVEDGAGQSDPAHYLELNTPNRQTQKGLDHDVAGSSVRQSFSPAEHHKPQAQKRLCIVPH